MLVRGWIWELFMLYPAFLVIRFTNPGNAYWFCHMEISSGVKLMVYVALIATLNVLERRREIGVMRSIGASSWRVIRLYIGEGILLGVLSWLIALPLSIPAAYGMATQGLSFALNAQLSYRFSPEGALIWLVIIIILAVFASTLPARSASRISVRESLTY